MVQLNADVLELIFRYLDFRSLCAAETTCIQWKQVINDRRLYWQLSKRLSAQMVPKFCDIAMEDRKRRRSEMGLDEKPRKERRLLRNYKPVKVFGKDKNKRNST